MILLSLLLEQQIVDIQIYSIPNIEGYDSLSIEGSTVRFSCPPSLALIGPNSVACTENGKWELNILAIVGQHVCNQKVTYIYYLVACCHY